MSETSAKRGSNASRTRTGDPVILIGIVARVEVDFCQDGVRHLLHSIAHTTRLLPTTDEARDFLERVAGSRQRVAVSGYPDQSAECQYLAVFHAGLPEQVLDATR